jgi:hypothetical protein
MKREAILVVLGLILWGISATCAGAQTNAGDDFPAAVDPKAKVNPELVYITIFLDEGGEQVYALRPRIGECVQTAVERLGPLPRQTNYIGLIRSGHAGGPEELWRIDWKGVGQFGNPGTNYLLQPGDRILVS